MERPAARRKGLSTQELTDQANALRTAYRAKSLLFSYGLVQSRDIFQKIWLDYLSEKKFDFETTMEMFKPQQNVEPYILGDLSTFLSMNNAIWKKWFFREFPRFAGDLGMAADPENAQVPRWVTYSMRNIDNETAHPDDPLFDKVPWRVFYMWCRMFRRFCAKYAVTMYLRLYFMDQRDQARRNENDPIRAGLRVGRIYDKERYAFETAQIAGRFDQSVALRLRGKDRPSEIFSVEFLVHQMLGMVHSPDLEDDSRNASSSVVFLLWLVYKNYTLQVFLGMVKQDKSFVERIQQSLEDEYTYNFNVKHVRCFMYWYVNRMIRTGQFDKYPEQGGPDPKALQVEIRYGEDVKYVKSFREMATETGCVTKENTWPMLENLPLAPRRFTKEDIARGAGGGVVFLGDDVLSGVSGDDDDDDDFYEIGEDVSVPDGTLGFLEPDLEFIEGRHRKGRRRRGRSSKCGGTSRAKWLHMAHEGTVKGHAVTGAQRRFFFHCACGGKK